MPKIKVKNIPVQIEAKICGFNRYYMGCSDCPLYNDKGECCRKTKTDPNYIVELPEPDFPTNRDWMEELSNEDLSALMTTGLVIHGGKYDGFKATISLITDKESMLDWLSQPCVYLEEEDDEKETKGV